MPLIRKRQQKNIWQGILVQFAISFTLPFKAVVSVCLIVGPMLECLMGEKMPLVSHFLKRRASVDSLLGRNNAHGTSTGRKNATGALSLHIHSWRQAVNFGESKMGKENVMGWQQVIYPLLTAIQVCVCLHVYNTIKRDVFEQTWWAIRSISSQSSAWSQEAVWWRRWWKGGGYERAMQIDERWLWKNGFVVV